MKKKVIAALCMLIAAMLLGAACAAPTAESPVAEAPAEVVADEVEPASEDDSIAGRIVGVTMMDMRQQYFIDVVAGMQEAADKYGIKLNVQDQENDSARQYTQLEDFITMDVDGMIICCVDAASAVELVDKAKKNDIPVIASGLAVENVDLLVGWDHYEYGYNTGKMAADWITANCGEEPIEVGVIGFDLSEELASRTGAIVDAINEHAPNATVVSVQNSSSMEEAMQVTENMMQEHPDIRVICCMDDDNGGLGANEVMNSLVAPEERGKYAVFGADGVAEAVNRIKEGGCYKGTIDIQPYEQGKLCIEYLVKMWQGEDVGNFVGVDTDTVIDYEAAMKK